MSNHKKDNIKKSVRFWLNENAYQEKLDKQERIK